MGDALRLMAITQFEDTSARRAFPCFDEPHLKASFSLSVGRHGNEVTCSNVEDLEHWPGAAHARFQPICLGSLQNKPCHVNLQSGHYGLKIWLH